MIKSLEICVKHVYQFQLLRKFFDTIYVAHHLNNTHNY
jgi:hypothetical protein